VRRARRGCRPGHRSVGRGRTVTRGGGVPLTPRVPPPPAGLGSMGPPVATVRQSALALSSPAPSPALTDAKVRCPFALASFSLIWAPARTREVARAGRVVAVGSRPALPSLTWRTLDLPGSWGTTACVLHERWLQGRIRIGRWPRDRRCGWPGYVVPVEPRALSPRLRLRGLLVGSYSGPGQCHRCWDR
jgi:hypothetical protein